jgi:hypothetical protein
LVTTKGRRKACESFFICLAMANSRRARSSESPRPAENSPRKRADMESTTQRRRPICGSASKGGSLEVSVKSWSSTFLASMMMTDSSTRCAKPESPGQAACGGNVHVHVVVVS